MRKPEHPEIQKIENRLIMWLDFFRVNTTTHGLQAPLEDLRLFVRYIVYLKAINRALERESIWNWNSFFVGWMLGIVFLAAYIWGTH